MEQEQPQQVGEVPPEDAVGDEGGDHPQQVCRKFIFVTGHNFNHLIKEPVEQVEPVEQGVGEVPPVDDPEVEKFAIWRVFISIIFSWKGMMETSNCSKLSSSRSRPVRVPA